MFVVDASNNHINTPISSLESTYTVPLAVNKYRDAGIEYKNIPGEPLPYGDTRTSYLTISDHNDITLTLLLILTLILPFLLILILTCILNLTLLLTCIFTVIPILTLTLHTYPHPDSTAHLYPHSHPSISRTPSLALTPTLSYPQPTAEESPFDFAASKKRFVKEVVNFKPTLVVKQESKEVRGSRIQGPGSRAT